MYINSSHKHHSLNERNKPVRTFSTVTQLTIWRRPQFIHVESSTIANPDVIPPQTALIAPVITNSSNHHALGHCRMSAVEPAGCVGTTSPFSHAGSWHGGTGGTCEAVPSGGQILVTYHNFVVDEVHVAIGFAESFVGSAFWS